MARSPFQVAAFPFVTLDDHLHVAIFRRRVEGYWQSIAGGGEDEETPAQAVQRETFEEAGIPLASPLVPLQTRASVPVTYFRDRDHWDKSILVIPVYYFGIASPSVQLRLSDEHTDYQWLSIDAAHALLKWDSDKTALWELEQMLNRRITQPGSPTA